MTTRDLILWRHADAGESTEDDADLLRSLTPKGEKQAQRMAAWLKRQLPDTTRVISSPATRAEQTTMALQRPYKLRDELAPHASVQDLLHAAQWGQYRGPILIVGHQPTLGQLVGASLQPQWSPSLGVPEPAAVPSISIRKGALWWLRLRSREEQTQVVVVCVQTPELL